MTPREAVDAINQVLDQFPANERERIVAAVHTLLMLDMEVGVIGPDKGERKRGPRASFTDAEVAVLRQQHQERRLDVAALAQERGVTQSAVYNMLVSHTYKHVKG